MCSEHLALQPEGGCAFAVPSPGDAVLLAVIVVLGIFLPVISLRLAALSAPFDITSMVKLKAASPVQPGIPLRHWHDGLDRQIDFVSGFRRLLGGPL